MAAPVQLNRSMTVVEWSLLLTLSVLWGGSFFFVGLAVRELPALTIVVLRVSLAAAILWLILLLAGANVPRGRPVWKAFFCMGFLNNVVPFCLFVWGQSHIASGVASILNATTPLFTVLVAHRFTPDERMTRDRLAGVVIGFAGVAVMIGSDVLASLGVNSVAQLGCLAAALSYAFAGVYGRRFRRMGLPPITTAAGQLAASSLMLIPVMLAADRPWTFPVPSEGTILALAGLATLSTALAYILYFSLLSSAGATNLLLVTFLIPVSAILLGVLFLNETLLPKHLAGMLLIGTGLAAIDGRPRQMLQTLLLRRRASAGVFTDGGGI